MKCVFLFPPKVSSIPYKDQIADLIGCKPNLSRLFFRDPLLALKCYFGPCCAAQYRLMGPGAWPGAKQVIEDTYSNNMFPHVKRRNQNTGAKNEAIVKLLKLVCLFATVATLKELCQDLNVEWEAVWGWLRAGRWTATPWDITLKTLVVCITEESQLVHLRVKRNVAENTALKRFKWTGEPRCYERQQTQFSWVETTSWTLTLSAKKTFCKGGKMVFVAT